MVRIPWAALLSPAIIQGVTQLVTDLMAKSGGNMQAMQEQIGALDTRTRMLDHRSNETVGMLQALRDQLETLAQGQEAIRQAQEAAVRRVRITLIVSIAAAALAIVAIAMVAMS